MSALAKVFVVFVFLLSILFFGTSATLYLTREDWAANYDTYPHSMHEMITYRFSVESLRKVWPAGRRPILTRVLPKTHINVKKACSARVTWVRIVRPICRIKYSHAQYCRVPELLDEPHPPERFR